jgi:hypothetical protein
MNAASTASRKKMRINTTRRSLMLAGANQPGNRLAPAANRVRRHAVDNLRKTRLIGVFPRFSPAAAFERILVDSEISSNHRLLYPK